MAFHVVKLIGAAYLVFLGVRAFFQHNEKLRVPAHFATTRTAAAFRQGILTNLLNPKVALFFLAFLPQFIDPASPAKVPAFVTLGLAFVATGTLWCLILAWFASAFSERLRGSNTISAILNRAVGSLFIFMGIRLAVSK